MKIFRLAFSVFILVIASCVFAGKPGGCSDVPVTYSFVAPDAGVATMLNDDPSKVYQNGAEGVDNAMIHYNRDCNGTHDATIVIGSGPKAKRKLRLQLPNAIPDSIIEAGPPAFAGGASFLSSHVFINIRNLTGYTAIPPGVAATYYTRMSLQFRGPDQVAYRLTFYPDDFACPAGELCVPNLHPVGASPTTNQPVETQ